MRLRTRPSRGSGCSQTGSSRRCASSVSGATSVGRMGEISDIVDAILYLESVGFVMGEILHVEAGQSAGH
jgi:hypothetical protein